MIKHYFCDEPNIMPNWYNYYLVIPSEEFRNNENFNYFEFIHIMDSFYDLYKWLITGDGDNIDKINNYKLYINIVEKIKDVPVGANIYIGYKREVNSTSNYDYIIEVKLCFCNSVSVTQEKIIDVEVTTT